MSVAVPADRPEVPPLLTRIRHRGERELTRVARNAFTSRSDRCLLVHCTHHKSGTLWFRQVVLAVARPYGLRYQQAALEPIRPNADFVLYYDAGKFHPEGLGERRFRGSHVVRDPRDLVVSGYEYHLRTSEKWALRPNPHYGGTSYQEHLRSLDEHDGLMAEIDWVARNSTTQMAAWDYDRPEFLELRYEDAIADEPGTFERLFRWYGFNEAAVALGLEAVEAMSRRNGGAVRNHVRSGEPGEWRSRLAPEHIAHLKEVTGDLVVRLGYETDADW